MIKIIGILCLLVGFCGVSIEKIKEEKEQIKALEGIRNFAEYLIKEIEYSHIPIPDICKEYRSKADGNFREFLGQVCIKFEKDGGRGFEQIWNKEAKDYFGFKEEKMWIMNLGQCFGFTNVGHQLASVRRYLHEIEKRILYNEKKFQDNKKLILYFGVMSGLLLSIILL